MCLIQARDVIAFLKIIGVSLYISFPSRMSYESFIIGIAFFMMGFLFVIETISVILQVASYKLLRKRI